MAKAYKEGTWLVHHCPGCRQEHLIAIDEPFPNGAVWSWNNDPERPTVTPSINIVGRCHYFIREGMIEFCGDSQHEFAGQTLPLEDVEG